MQELKTAFTSAPLLFLSKPFVVEVDASTSGVSAALSQQQESSKLLPCTAFSKKLTPAEQNYDIGNSELLAIKPALEEWRHWLEVAQHPCTVLTDHKNLQYLREDKRLNPRQARWALFFKHLKNATDLAPPGCPPVHTYVPRAQRLPLIQSSHSSLCTGHPGISQVMSRI